MAGIGAGVGGALGGVDALKNVAGSPFLSGAVRGALGNALTQGIAVATRLQRKFDFAGVAVGAAVGGVTAGLGKTLDIDWGGGFSFGNMGEQLIASGAGAIAGAAMRSVLTGSSFGDNIIASLPDVIGSTIGSAFAGAVTGRPAAAKGNDFSGKPAQANGKPIQLARLDSFRTVKGGGSQDGGPYDAVIIGTRDKSAPSADNIVEHITGVDLDFSLDWRSLSISLAIGTSNNYASVSIGADQGGIRAGASGRLTVGRHYLEGNAVIVANGGRLSAAVNGSGRVGPATFGGRAAVSIAGRDLSASASGKFASGSVYASGAVGLDLNPQGAALRASTTLSLGGVGITANGQLGLSADGISVRGAGASTSAIGTMAIGGVANATSDHLSVGVAGSVQAVGTDRAYGNIAAALGTKASYAIRGGIVPNARPLAAKSAGVGGASTVEARGGTYVLRDAEGTVVRSGRTNDLARREAEHLRDPNLAEYQFEPAYRTDVYAEQRGLEQILHDRYNPALNKIRPISPSNKRLPTYMDAAQKYLLEHGEP